jgi:hypothetical protein
LKTSSLGDLLEPDKGVAWLPIGRTRNKSTNPELTELALKTSSLGDLLEPDKGCVADRSQDVLHYPGLPLSINIIIYNFKNVLFFQKFCTIICVTICCFLLRKIKYARILHSVKK